VLRAVEQFAWWKRLLWPGLGILAAALLVRRFLRRSGGGLDVMEAVVLRRGPLHLREEGVRVLAALGVIGTGGSVGPEGPVVELGAALGSRLATLTRAHRKNVSLLTACGAAAGLAAAFKAPIGAAIFVLEIMMIGRLSLERFAPVVVASVTATTVAQAALGPDPVFKVDTGVSLAHPFELAAAAVLGVLGGLVGAVFLRVLDDVPAFLQRARVPFWVRALGGGVVVGGIGIFYPQVLGAGFEATNEVFRTGALGWATLTVFLLVWMKMIATSVTLGSGGLGGVFAPTLFVGAALGASYGAVLHGVLPGDTAPPLAYALMGMAALVGATLHAPVTAILLLFELSRDYALVPSLMLAGIVGTVVSRRLHPWSLYTGRLRKRGVDLSGGEGDLVLATVSAGTVMDPVRHRILAGEPAAAVLRRMEAEEEGEIYVVSREGRLLGWIRSEDLAGIPAESLEGVAVAGDLARPLASVPLTSTLAEALEVLDRSGHEEIPVVETAEGQRLRGVLTRRAVLRRMRSGE